RRHPVSAQCPVVAADPAGDGRRCSAGHRRGGGAGADRRHRLPGGRTCLAGLRRRPLTFTQRRIMANPEELRKEDQKLPKARRKYPQSRVTQSLWVLLAIVVIAWLIS